MADLAKAKILIELRRLEDAGRELRAILAVEPDNAEAATYLAQTAFLSRDYREAAAQCANALRTAPKHQFALRIQALTLLHLDQHARARAEQSARRALALGPGSAENHRILAIVLRERGRPAEALEVIDRAAELDPAEPDIHLVRGSVLRRLGRSGARHRPGPAVAAYREALRLQPENAGAVHDLALVDLDRGRLRPALRGVLSAATMDPTLTTLVRGNVAVVIRRAARRVHWSLATIALLSLLLGSFPDATAAGGEWSPGRVSPMQVKVERVAPQNGSPQGDPSQTGSSTTPSGPTGGWPGLPDGLTIPPIPTFPSLSPMPSEDIAPTRVHGGAALGSAGRVVAGGGLGVLVLVAVWWLGVIPWRRRRFVVAAAWASPATATRLVVVGLGVVGCAVAAVTGLRGSLTLVFFLLVVAGVVLRRLS
ncbi:tetratricopeptide repeat protein [Nocardia terpenica]|uniref:Tetratricopeptide repeat protein n=1 Tax=Nocardia terpenica TaxID=455432 RepID=A0A6G9YV87_9NOCA|nr:tetratricopeptide repeat protein [Nocardia terpenica]QIS17255.1 tetratricopeptide repeat protein [Nocardia terpenica]